MHYKKLDWPALTHEQNNELLSLADSANASKNIRTHNYWKNTYHRYALPDSINNWCRKHLPIDKGHIIVLQRFFNWNTIPIHSDITRSETFIYLLSKSGPITRWHNDDETTVVNEVCLPQHQWYCIDVKTKHEVINMQEDRIAISIFKSTHVYTTL